MTTTTDVLEELLDVGDAELVGRQRQAGGEAGQVIAGAARLVERRRGGDDAAAVRRPGVAREVPEQAVRPPARMRTCVFV